MHSGRIPQLPHEDVHAEEEESEALPKVRARTGTHMETAREKRTYTSRIPYRDLKSAAKKAAKKSAEDGRTILGQLGGLLMALCMALSVCTAKLGALACTLKGKMASRVREDGHAPGKPEEIELEAIRPEDYHGRAQHRNEQKPVREYGHAARRVARRRTGRAMPRFDMQSLLSLVFAGVAVVSACMIVSILWRTVRTNATNKKVAELYAQSAELTPAPDATPELIVFMPEETQPESGEDAVLADGGEPQASSQPDTLPGADALSGAQLPEEDGVTTGETEDETQPESTPAAAEATIAPMGKRIYHHVGGDALPQMAALHKENRDIVGWLKIENVLDLPVVYRDNSYYLKRDFYKQKNTAGTIFLDENHPFKAKTQNLLLHGHNMKDGTMFGRLLQYETDLNYVRWHPFVRFDTLWRKEEYVIFAVLRVSLDVRSEDFFNYFSYPTFVSDEQFMAYIRQLQLRSIYAIPVDVKPTDALLTMSTCLEDDRLVIVARRVREGETHTELRQVTNLTTRQ